MSYTDYIRIVGLPESELEEFQGRTSAGGGACVPGGSSVAPASGLSPGGVAPGDMGGLLPINDYVASFEAWDQASDTIINDYQVEVESSGENLPAVPSLPAVPLWDWALVAAAAAMSPPMAAILLAIRFASHVYVAHKKKQLQDIHDGLPLRAVVALEDMSRQDSVLDIDTDRAGRIVRLYQRSGLAVNIAR